MGLGQTPRLQLHQEREESVCVIKQVLPHSSPPPQSPPPAMSPPAAERVECLQAGQQDVISLQLREPDRSERQPQHTHAARTHTQQTHAGSGSWRCRTVFGVDCHCLLPQGGSSVVQGAEGDQGEARRRAGDQKQQSWTEIVLRFRVHGVGFRAPHHWGVHSCDFGIRALKFHPCALTMFLHAWCVHMDACMVCVHMDAWNPLPP